MVEGNVVENGAGRVVVYGLVKGNVTERNDDDDLEYFSVNISDGGRVEGSVTQHGSGSVRVRNLGVVEGNVVENDAGIVRVPGLVKGNVTEWNDGDRSGRQRPQHRRRRRHRARQRPVQRGELGADQGRRQRMGQRGNAGGPLG